MLPKIYNNHIMITSYYLLVFLLPSIHQYIYLFSGIREADINVAEGKKRAKVLNSEAFQIEQINIANGTLFTMIKLSKIQLIFHKFCVEFNPRN